MAHNSDIELFHSKSAAAADDEAGHDGLGGRISADLVSSLIARPMLVLSAVTITKIGGKNLSGVGKFVFKNSGQTLAWQAPRDKTAGTSVAVGAGGTFELESSTENAWIEVSVVAVDLPIADTEENAVIDAVKNVLFDDVSLDEAMKGTPNYACLFLKNTGAVSYKNVVPVIEVPGLPTRVRCQGYYPQSGDVQIEIDDARNFPSSYYIRNTRTQEIMYYNSRGGTDGRTLVVSAAARGQRMSSPAEGNEGDTIELVSPIDMSIGMYNSTTGEPVIVQDSVAPSGINFFAPPTSDPPHYQTAFTLAAGEVLSVWLKRNVPKGAINIAALPLRLGFKYDPV